MPDRRGGTIFFIDFHMGLWLIAYRLQQFWDVKGEQTTILWDGQVRFIYLLRSRFDVREYSRATVIGIRYFDIRIARFILRNYIGQCV